MRLLTQDELEQLPDGTEIVVTWSGGNGPHRYKLTNNERNGPTIYGKYGNWIGDPHARSDKVWLPEEGDDGTH